ncbi:TPA: SIMPL domain-containing protein [Burkholderia multivorans]|uniref:SIMPL domain-containing protein n=1 Tax=Burkholderia multivorans TaxID=87883 RepID=UPI000CFF24CA|nr:SIMPL domain-containing protein [Burkholderia multivorans]MBU9297490.1 SIMPL domain-containing protein [Burkholderia multivorans]MBU9302967.1 SIMPL domain-containing protein [Burkholderia multivorans]MBU9405181.1 SIMPL domain-containing protein [Burkholderia multivorans]MBU9500955.1 SIMPL domain-containing protein [Burkholderia multivorans]MBU9507117.1 SIMPL domain-containing protein [Burkholderia multivorans]
MTKKSAVALSLALAAALPVALTLASPAAHAQAVNPHFPEPAGVLSLSSQASADVPQDIIHITLFYEQQAKDPGSLTSALNQRADAALAQAKGVSGVSAHTGAFSVYPSTDRDGKISAWRGRTEVVLESRDFAAASKLAGQLSNLMQVANVEFSLSPEAQRAAEQKLTTEAIKSFRARADEAAKAFGYSSYTIRDVNVGSGRNVQPYPRMMAMAAAPMDSAKMSAPIAVEGGKATVSVTVNGSVQMK